MAPIEWSDVRSVNVDEIDRQHQRPDQMINELNDAMKQGRGKDRLGKTVDGLIGYAGTHFATEERYFDQFGYLPASAHKGEHRAFVEKMSGFQDDFAKGRTRTEH